MNRESAKQTAMATLALLFLLLVTVLAFGLRAREN